MQVIIETQPKSVIKVTVTVPSEKVAEEENTILNKIAKDIEVKGFRKGNAPVNLVKEKLNPDKLYSETINSLLQKYYTEALKEKNILPICNPTVEIKEFKPNTDFIFTATVATKPEVKLGDYRKAIKQLHEKQKTESKKLNEEKLKKGEKLEEVTTKLSANDIIKGLVEVLEMELADMVIEEESNRLLGQLIQQAQTVGFSMEQYLKSRNTTAEQLHKEYDKQAEANLKAEFALNKAIQEEKIEITEEELNKIFEADEKQETKDMAKTPLQRWYIKNMLEKSKLINKLIEELDNPSGKEDSNENK